MQQCFTTLDSNVDLTHKIVYEKKSYNVHWKS